MALDVNISYSLMNNQKKGFLLSLLEKKNEFNWAAEVARANIHRRSLELDWNWNENVFCLLSWRGRALSDPYLKSSNLQSFKLSNYQSGSGGN